MRGEKKGRVEEEGGRDGGLHLHEPGRVRLYLYPLTGRYGPLVSGR